ncbi:MAG: SdpI family protein [Lachnospiraceae bacterium]|nr:SdpI family protein [Lachnospiraceae bacterium]
MLKTNRGYMIVTSLITLIPMIVGLILWEQLPDTIATHFGSTGEANGWSSKPFAVFGIPLFVLAVHWICAVATEHDPRHQNISEKMYRLILLICPLVSLLCAVAIYPFALGININSSFIGELFIGFVLVVIGNYLPKCRRNYTVGIKLPWTIHDEENWNRTHRLAGWLWMICGLLVLLNTFLRFGGEWLMITVFLVMILVPMGYSFGYYVKHKEKNE